MKRVAMVIFDQFTDLDLFLMWELFGRHKALWQVSILGTQKQHTSYNGLAVNTHGPITQANDADVVLFSSGKGTRAVIQDQHFLDTFKLDPSKQVIGFVCSGALILAKLGLLNGVPATTHPRAKQELEALGVTVVDRPLICHGNIATAGGCLSATYLSGWAVEKLYGREMRRRVLQEILPVGQTAIFEDLIDRSIAEGQAPLDQKKTASPIYTVATSKPTIEAGSKASNDKS